MYYALSKATHAVAKDSRKSAQNFHLRKLAKARESWQKLAKSHPSAKAYEHVLAQNAARESQSARRESVAKGTCERRAQ